MLQQQTSRPSQSQYHDRNGRNGRNGTSRSILSGGEDMANAMDIMFTQGDSQMTVQDGQGYYQGGSQGMNATPQLSIQARLTGGKSCENIICV